MNKKLLALVMAVIFVLGTVATGFAGTFEDVVDTDFEDEVNRLVALEVLSGYPDGTFRPEGLVTRAEFAKIVVSATGVGAAAEYAQGATKFTDVAAEHWAAGYINVATDLGIIQGYGDGRFGAEDQVTYAEAITMVVRSLGYEPAAQAKGGYPGGYLAVAAENDITDGITVLANVAANRGDIAVMVDNSLEVDMMVQDGYGDRPTWKVKEGETLLSKLGVDEVEGKVIEIARVNDKLDDDEIVVEYKDGDDVKDKKYELVSKDNPEALFGLGVKLLVKNKKVVHVEIDTSAKDILVDTVEVTGATKDMNLVVTDKEYNWIRDDKNAVDVEIYINFESKAYTNVADGMYGTFILDGRDVAFANLFEFDDVGLVTDVAKDEIEFVVLGTNGVEDALEFDDYDDVYIYNKDFTAASVEDIDEGSVIYYWEDGDDAVFVVVVNEIVKGEVTRARTDEVRVGGKYYEYVAGETIVSENKGKDFAVYSNATDLLDEDVVLYLDLNGDVAAVVTDADVTSDTLYGIATWLDTGRKSILTIFTADGKEVDYYVEKETDTLAGLAVEDKEGKYAVVEYKLNSDGDIAKKTLKGFKDVGTSVTNSDKFEATGETSAAAGVYDLKKDADKKYMVKSDDSGRFYITKDTVIMSALDGTDFDPATMKYEDLVEMDLKASEGKAIVFGEENKNAKFIVFLDGGFTGVKEDTYYGVVTSKPEKEGKNWYAKIDVFGEGEEEYKVENTLSKGDMLVFKLDSKDKVIDQLKTTVTGTVYEVDGSFIRLDSISGDVYKVLDGAVIYKLDEDGDLDGTIRRSKVGAYEAGKYTGDFVEFYIDKGEVKAMLVTPGTKIGS